MVHSLATDTKAYLYDDLANGDGETAARELLLLLKKFVCKKYPEFTSEAEDIALEAFERVCEKVHTFRGNSKFLTWVCGIALNVLREKIRDKKKHSVLEELLEDFVADHSDPEQQLIEQTTHEVNLILVKDALQTLTERQRGIYECKHTTNMTSPEIGEKFGISAGAVRSALVDATARIERWREEKGYST